MNPDDIVLVALINSPRDLELVRRERWYRIPVNHAPRFFDGAQYLAFYLSSAFGEEKWAVHEYAAVRGHELVQRRDLLPAEQNHPRADELYYKLQLGALVHREPPIRSHRGRRILFLWTDWKRFSAAEELNDLFVTTPDRDKLWEAIKADNLDAEREVFVREGQARYRVDFLVYCPRGRIAIRIGEAARRFDSSRRFRSLHIAESDLADHFEGALERVRQAAREMGQSYTLQGAQA